MTCSSCKWWKTIRTTGSEREDSQMFELGYRNCAKYQTEFAYARFIYGESTKCGKYEQGNKTDK